MKKNFFERKPGENKKIVFLPPEDPEVREGYEKMKPWITVPKKTAEKMMECSGKDCPFCKEGIPRRNQNTLMK